VREACEASLQRLGIDTIDLYYLHRWDVMQLRALARLTVRHCAATADAPLRHPCPMYLANEIRDAPPTA
jgi:aryl-alcohol dehydrogenase-like predicted oxidoreductase